MPRHAWDRWSAPAGSAGGFVILLLVPGNVAEFTEGFDVLGLVLQCCQGRLLMDGGHSQGKLDAFILGVEFEGLAILPCALLRWRRQCAR